jgi:protein-S-isoprenylcysteine O-methyltransferase Ste14
MNIEGHIWIVGLWLLFGIWHSAFASVVIKRKAERGMGSYYSWYRPIYSVIALVQTALILGYQFSVESIYLWQNGPAASSLFSISALAGLAVMAISIKKYFFKLSGVEVLYKKKKTPALETSGLHEYVRHPLYCGTLLFAWSLFLVFPALSYGLTCIMMTAYTLAGIILEEKKLENLFGQPYRVYKNNVPMIIPFIKFGRLSKPLSDKLS